MYTIASIRTSMSYLLENARNKQRHYGRNRNKSIVFFRLRGCGFTVASFDFPRICLIYQHSLHVKIWWKLWRLGKVQSYKIEDFYFMLNYTSLYAQIFVSTSLNIIHCGCTFHLGYPHWTITPLYENTMSSSITVTVHKLS
jgi:hypothetical protein